MIVLKPISDIKIGNVISQLTIGKKVPADVEAYWKETKQYDAILKAGMIGESEKSETHEKPKEFSRDEKK